MDCLGNAQMFGKCQPNSIFLPEYEKNIKENIETL